MELRGAVALVTGAGRGIGAALARALADEGADAIAVVDLDRSAAGEVAAELAASHPQLRTTAVCADVADPAAVEDMVARVEATLGPLDLFVANAGIGGGGGLDAPLEVWAATWDVNVMSHVHAARVVVPRMLARGGGAFVTTASAAGLLTNLGNAPYSVTKHAAVAFAEWLAITHGEQGLYVACVCPMGVDTDLLRSGLHTLEGASVAATRVLAADEAAGLVVQGLREGRFLVLTHPETAQFEQHRAADHDRWIEGMRRLQAHVRAQLAEG